MAKKLQYEQISTEIKAFVDTTYEHFDNNYAYAAGALQYQLAHILTLVPAYKQQETLKILGELKAKYAYKGI